MDKFYINRNREPLTPEDVAKGKNFDAFLKAYSAKPKPFWGSKKMYFSFVAGGVIAVVGTYVVMNNSGKTPADNSKTVFVIPKPDAPQLKDTTYVVDAAKGADVFYRTGSLIHIPANAFLDSTGKPVSGNVQIFYREFHDTASAMHAGIPLCTDSAGKNCVTASAGMLAISAWQNGKPLAVNASNLIRVAMADQPPVQHCRVSSLTSASGKWMIDHEAMNVAVGFVADTAKDNTAAANVPMPIKPNKADKSKHSFVIAFEPSEFPELAVYKGVRFEVDETKTPYKRSDRNIQWEDVSIARNADKKSYTITFTQGANKSTYVSSAVVDDVNYNSAMKIYNEKYAAYEEALKLKQQLPSKGMNADASRIFGNDSLLSAALAMCRGNNTGENLVMCEFTISSFGIWNADHVTIVP